MSRSPPLPSYETDLIDLSVTTPTDADADGDFGAFVSSAPVSQPVTAQLAPTAPMSLHPFDPLAALESSPGASSSTSSATATSSEFFSGAKQRAHEKRASVLNELLEHEDEPLYWIERAREDETVGALREGIHTPMFENPPAVALEAPAPRPAREAFDLLDNRPASRSDEGPPSPPSTPLDYYPVPLAPPPRRPDSSPTTATPHTRSSSLHQAQASTSRSHSHSRSPTLHSEASSASMQSALSLGGTLGRKWMSNLLSTASTASAAASTPPADPAQFSPRRTDSMSILSHAVGTVKSVSVAASAPLSGSVTHGTPFSRNTFVPPTGAPAFRGDRSWNASAFEYDATVDAASRLSLRGRLPVTTAILNDALAAQLRAHLPALSRLQDTWTLLYSLDQHGISLSTLYKRCALPFGEETPRQALLVVRDADDGVFGAFVGDGVTQRRGYYGSGESFLWRTTTGDVQVFRWTGANTYVALCEPEFLSFGGGDGHYGLWLDASLFDGSSARCPTFDNDVLCGAPRAARRDAPVRRPRSESGAELDFGDMHAKAKVMTEKFECVGLEVWWIGS